MLVALASAKGSPGVTTAALALAAVWPRPALLADLDPAGGDIALRLRGPHGEPLDPEQGLLSLAAALRRDAQASVTDHVQLAAGGLQVLVGVASPEQVAAVGAVWHRVVDALASGPVDVVADCGRVAGASPARTVLRAADLVLLLTRNRVTDVAHLRERVRTLDHAAWRGRAGVVIVAEQPRRDSSEVRRLLESSGLALPVLGAVAVDRRGAVALEEAERWRASRSTLVSSVRDLAAGLVASTGHRAGVSS